MSETILAISLGVGLAAACGFRVFVPLFALSLAALSGHVELHDSFAWVGTLPALVAFGVATFLEIGAYYFPLVDNLLDSVASPAAVVAGVVATASCVTDMSPLMQWSVAIIAGGGAAGVVQLVTVKARLATAAFTGGTLNPVVSTLENVGAIFLSVLGVLLPALALVLAVVAVFLLWRWSRRRQAAAAA
ncbi:MAG: DUF4126 domain-containing protein [Deltaproteobacteria bacterium]|nr:DUF4126 domain-containing protein [Deltaproteobacteria bacterium]